MLYCDNTKMAQMSKMWSRFQSHSPNIFVYFTCPISIYKMANIPTDFGPDSGGRVKVNWLSSVCFAFVRYSINSCFYWAGIDDHQANCLRKCSSFIWKETRRRWSHASMECLCETVRERRHVIICEKSPFQTARKLCKSKSNFNKATVWSHRNWLGWIWSCDKVIFPRSNRTSRHIVSHFEIVSIAHRRRWNIHTRHKKSTRFWIIWRNSIPRTDTIDAILFE